MSKRSLKKTRNCPFYASEKAKEASSVPDLCRALKKETSEVISSVADNKYYKEKFSKFL